MSDNSVILMVEDNAEDILLVQRAFIEAALLNPLHVVHDGEEAIAYLRGVGKYANRVSHPLPDLLLLDLKLPRKDGFQVLNWVRSQPGLSRIRIVVLTISEQLRDVNRAYQLGADSFLVKPSDFQQVVSLVKTLRHYWITASKGPELSLTGRIEPMPAKLTRQQASTEAAT